MNRRTWLCAASAAFVAPWQGRGGRGAPQASIQTVTGPVPAGLIATALPHEHILVDFGGADVVSPDRYDRKEVFGVAIPHLRRIRSQGITSLFECTPAYLGRDPVLLKQLSEASFLRIITNTGYYAANGGKHLPAHAHTESADELAARWIAEARDGIDGSGIKPGFIKIGVDAGPLNDVSKKLVQAAARTHKATGLTIAAHSGDGTAAFEQLDLLEAEGVAPAAWIWVHAQAETDQAKHIEAAQRGAWVEFDGVAPETIEQHIGLIENLWKAEQQDHILLSHDAGWYHVGEPRGGTFRPYDTLVDKLVPALTDKGYTTPQLSQMLAQNPQRAFAPTPRLKTE